MFRRKKYKIIYADPPWSFSNKRTGGSMKSGAEQQYPCMSLKELKELPVKTICDESSVLVMWWVSSMPLEALQLAYRWGFEVKNMCGFVWTKTCKTDTSKDHFGMGFLTRSSVECALIAVKGKRWRESASVRQVVRTPVGKHSRKPGVVRDRIVELFGDVPKVELFATQKTKGWHTWGNVVPNDLRL